MKRDKTIDLAKGILILIVIFHHISFQARIAGFDNGCIQWNFYFLRLYAPWFMSAFLFITGYGSNFDKSFCQFINDCFRTILWPSITFYIINNIIGVIESGSFSTAWINWNSISVCGLDWFLTTLFFSKILFWLLHKYVRNEILLLGLTFILSIIAILCNDYNIGGNNWIHYRHTILFVVFINFGLLFKEMNLFEKINSIHIIVIYLLIVVVSFCLDMNVLGVAGRWISFDIGLYIPFIAYAIVGIIALIKVSNYLKNISLIEFIGKHSLSFYLIHTPVLAFFVKTVYTYFINPQNKIEAFIFNIMVFLSTVIVTSFFAIFLSNNRMSWILKLHIKQYRKCKCNCPKPTSCQK